MIVSLQHRFVYIGVPKCASTSIEKTLFPYGSIVLKSGTKHYSLSDYETFIEPMLRKNGVNTSGIDVFALFREPVSWLHSWWRYMSRPEVARIEHPRHGKYAGGKTFAEYAQRYIEKVLPRFGGLGPQERIISGRHAVTLFRYDDIDAFAQHISHRVGRPISWPRLNAAPRNDAEIATDLAARIREALHRDVAIYNVIPERRAQAAS